MFLMQVTLSQVKAAFSPLLIVGEINSGNGITADKHIELYTYNFILSR
jgi:hypothetical protein